MGRLDPTYSDVQREAIARAIIGDGLTAAEVAQLAIAGELAELPPFELPHSTAHDIAAQERTASDPHDEGNERQRLTRLVDNGWTMLERQVAEIEKRQEEAEGDLQAPDLTRLEKIARVAAGLEKMSQLISEHPPAKPVSPTHGNGSSAPSLLEQMQRDMEADPAQTDGS